MGIQMAFLSGQRSSQVAVETFSIERFVTTATSVSLIFSSTGVQFQTINGSNTILRNWVTPPTDADEWEVRATLESGSTPTGSALDSWLPLTTNRAWTLSSGAPGTTKVTVLTFDFRRAGDTDPEVTSTGNSISIEVLDIFR